MHFIGLQTLDAFYRLDVLENIARLSAVAIYSASEAW